MHGIESRVEQAHEVVQWHALDLVQGLRASVVAHFSAEREGKLNGREGGRGMTFQLVNTSTGRAHLQNEINWKINSLALFV